MNEGRDTIVIYPGSTHVRVGLASSSVPATFTQVVARRLRSPRPEPMDTCEAEAEEANVGEAAEQYCQETEALIKTRLKSLKLRPVPNATQQVCLSLS